MQRSINVKIPVPVALDQIRLVQINLIPGAGLNVLTISGMPMRDLNGVRSAIGRLQFD
jgi:hypothetical protein